MEFQGTVETLVRQGHTVFVEASPHPVLTIGVQATADATDTPIITTGSLRRDDGTIQRFLSHLAELHVRGVRVDWRPLFVGVSPVELPTYAFQRERFWLERTLPSPPRSRGDTGSPGKPLPGMDTPTLPGTWLAVFSKGTSGPWPVPGLWPSRVARGSVPSRCRTTRSVRA
ncbi:Polyketide synthase OS=Streptomyces antimycoticus OX=68175 GN=SSPO_089250 PE=4 SV=1 [Streptomyces antimycoticus]